MVALDLLGRRWALRVLWELRTDSLTFRDLRARCDDVSPSVLNTRLGELRDAALVERGDAGYVLTEHGRSLLDAIAPLNDWSTQWAKSIKAG